MVSARNATTTTTTTTTTTATATATATATSNAQMCEYHRTYLLTFECTNPQCRARYRIGRVLRPHPVAPPHSAFKFCALCGTESAGFVVNDSEETYWETLAQGFDLPVSIVKLMYDDWDPNEYARFSDYVQHMKDE